MPSVKRRVKRETRVAKVREGRLKAAEPTGRGSPKHGADAPQVCNIAYWPSGVQRDAVG